ncbi:hypothetical protein H5410_017369 [Solanum commersonii]|uniref:Uncharacterized protein n=1 Tax=Solanum commersonii TaxID=4109 RepID=A0A9J5ZZ35_SOLCO|nr:hypothetical protein H5410_017369 [Solanum commersonii]
MKCCSIWSEDAKKDLENDMYFSSKAKDLSNVMRVDTAHQVTKRIGALARNFVSEHFTTEDYVATYSGSF